ncbi:hypothetical protein O181_000651 [Austropuccinia psidii MF-1]|uniref:RRM domain-containing protein n=1 Tax=Austropuccinia psidii MF-1 TaxID=1389203 RepID=A0A9Q3B8X3_9BASI|nr:hypothetical protein [Austropuccinia psidii MF-1]
MVMERNNWIKLINQASTQVNDFQFHLGEQNLSNTLDEPNCEHSSSSAIAFLDLPPVHPPSPTNVFLANFPKSWNESDLAHIFEGIPILTVHVIRDKVGTHSGLGVSRGVGFVNVVYNHEAVALVKNLDRKIWLDIEAPLKIRLAKATAPHPKIEVDIQGIENPFSRFRQRELGFKRKTMPKINLLRELESVTSVAKRPMRPPSAAFRETFISNNVYNIWEPQSFSGDNELDTWPKLSKAECVPPYSGINTLNSVIVRPNSNFSVTVKKIEEGRLMANLPEGWNVKSPILPGLWQNNLIQAFHPTQPTTDTQAFQKTQSVQPARLPTSIEPFQKNMQLDYVPLLPAHEGWARNRSASVYGFIGGPAIDISSGTVVSPRHH